MPHQSIKLFKPIFALASMTDIAASTDLTGDSALVNAKIINSPRASYVMTFDNTAPAAGLHNYGSNPYVEGAYQLTATGGTSLFTLDASYPYNGVSNATDYASLENQYGDPTARFAAVDGGAFSLLSLKAASEYSTGAGTLTLTGNLASGGTVTQSISVPASGWATLTVNPNFVNLTSVDISSNLLLALENISYTVAPVSTSALLQNTWTLIGVPYNTGSNTVADVFGDDITTTYSTNWQVYLRNEATKTYVQLNATDTLTQGNGYWISSDTAATLDTTGTDTPVTTTGNCIAANGFTNGCFAIPLAFSGTRGQYNLLSHPFPTQVSWENVRFEITIETALTNCTVGTTSGTYLCTPSQAESDNVASKTMWQYNGSAFQPKDDVTSGMIGTLQPMEGFWVKALTTGVTLLIPKP